MRTKMRRFGALRQVRRTVIIAALLVALSLFFSLGSMRRIVGGEAGTNTGSTGKPTVGIALSLGASSAPPVGGTTTLTLTATPELDIDTMQLEIILPAEIKFVGGAASGVFTGVPAGSSRSISANVQILDFGFFEVTGIASDISDPELAASAADDLFFDVTEAETIVSDEVPPARQGPGADVVHDGEVIPEVSP